MAAGHLAFIPKGFRFQPTNEEVFDHFLPRKNLGQRDFGDYVPDIDDTKLDPWELRDKYKGKLSHQRNEKEWWFFSPRTREGTTKRTTGSGRWRSTCKDKEIRYGGEKQMLGTMKTFAFHRRSDASYTRDNWILHEYHLSNWPLQDKETYFVLCCLNENDGKAKNKTGGEVGHPGLSGIDQPEVRQRNREISSQAPPSKRPKEPTDAPSGHWNEGPDSTKPDEDIYGCLDDLPAPNNSQVLTFESLPELVVPRKCWQVDSPESSGEDGPAEGKKASVENRNAKPPPPSSVSRAPAGALYRRQARAPRRRAIRPPDRSASRWRVLRLFFKVAWSVPRLFSKARVVKEELTAANPLRNKTSEAGEQLVQETKEKSGPKSKCENQDPLILPPDKDLTDVTLKISRLGFQEKGKEEEGTRERRSD